MAENLASAPRGRPAHCDNAGIKLKGYELDDKLIISAEEDMNFNGAIDSYQLFHLQDEPTYSGRSTTSLEIL
jgi:hypothetical protein